MNELFYISLFYQSAKSMNNIHYNVWADGIKLNANPLVYHMAHKVMMMHRINYSRDAKVIRAWTL